MTNLKKHKTATSSDRSEWIDALRGFALLGILLVNIQVFSGYVFLDADARAQLPWNNFDGVAIFIERVLVEGKFYALFSFMFGMGFAIQMRNTQKNNIDFKAAHISRMTWLLIFGLIHAFLIWFGDILIFYAILGFALLLFRKRSDRVILVWALLFLTTPIWFYVGYLALLQTANITPIAPLNYGGFSTIFDTLANGSYLEVIKANIDAYTSAGLTTRVYRFQFFRIFGMFLLGVWAVRIGLAGARESVQTLLKRWLLLGIVVGLPMSIAFVTIGTNVPNALVNANLYGLLSVVLDSIGVPLLTLSYVAVFGLYWKGIQTSDKPQQLFVASGRMALTHYLSQSVVCVLVFYGFGFGFFGKSSITISIIVAPIVYLGLAMLCRGWLKFYAQGPMEALWRHAQTVYRL